MKFNYGLLLAAMLLGTCLLLLVGSAQAHQHNDEEAGDFAEFDDFEDEAVAAGAQAAAAAPAAGAQASAAPPAAAAAVVDDFYANDEEDDEEDGRVQNEEDDEDDEGNSEFEHFRDDDEDEDVDDVPVAKAAEPKVAVRNGGKVEEPKLTMAKVPMHFRTHWDSYWLELIMIAGLVVYFINYCLGRTRNTRIASRWLAAQRQLLEANFCLISGATDASDAGRPSAESEDGADAAGEKQLAFSKESESLYTLWCSGRTCCEGMLVELKMIKRQDLVAVLGDLLRPSGDQLHIKVEISKDCMDTFVFAVGAKRTGSRLFKEMADLSKYCIQVGRPEEKYGVPAGFSVLSEIAEASAAMLDGRCVAALNKYASLIDYIHISDQFSGAVQQDDPSVLKQPDVRRMLMCGFNLPKKSAQGNDDDESDEGDATTPLLVLVFYLMERLRRYRLSKEGKAKADKNRARVEEDFLKSTSSARAEAAALRREEKRKQEKDKILAEEDPEKQRRWELKEQKRQAKKKQPKTKQLSIKAF